jgi:hypothetical protein
MLNLLKRKQLPSLTDDQVKDVLNQLADATWPIATATYRGATDEHRREAIQNAIDILASARLIEKA